jgi:hypothetical protein
MNNKNNSTSVDPLLFGRMTAAHMFCYNVVAARPPVVLPHKHPRVQRKNELPAASRPGGYGSALKVIMLR